jgi:hypothetical protein
VQGSIEPLILQVFDTEPRAGGYRATVWTAPLLQYSLQEVHPLDVSHKSRGRAMARLSLRWKRPRHTLARHPETWRQATGGSHVVLEATSGQ